MAFDGADKRMFHQCAWETRRFGFGVELDIVSNVRFQNQIITLTSGDSTVG